MPYKFETDKKIIPKNKDKRIKLTAADKEEIQYRYLKVGGVSQRELAREYGVSRRLIVFCIYPDRLKDNFQARAAKGGSKQYYDKDKQKVYMKTHRQYKKTLDDQGLLINKAISK